MKLSSALPLVVALSLSAPANSAMAGGSQIRSDGFNRVHFDPRNGRLNLRRPDKLSPVEREEAIVEALYGFRGLVDNCLENGTPGDTKVGPYEERLTVNCGDGGPVASCTFEGGGNPWNSGARVDNELRVTCIYPDGGEARLGHTMQERTRYVEPAESEAERLKPGACTAPAGCTERVTQVETVFSGTNSRKRGPAGKRGASLTLLNTVTQGSDGTVEVSAGPDSFGVKRKHYIGPFDALSEFFIHLREAFLERIRSKNPSTHRPAEGLLAADLRKPGLFDLSAQ